MSEHELHDLRRQVPARLSPRVYWALSLLLVAAYLAVWLASFRYVYGCQIDDWACYVKGLHTVEDPKAAFTMRTNALQPYFFLYSYLPIWSGISVPSYELPAYGDRTGNFRFLLLYTVFFHGLVALSWAWFARRIAASDTVALLSTLLLLSSEEFILWTPLPETRLIGLPLALLGLWLIIRPDRLPAGAAGPGQRVQPHAARLFLAGSLFWLAQSLHYTALYLIVPMTIALWLWELRGGWRRRGWWLGWGAFALGCVWLQGLLELLSRYWVGLPWSSGPTMSLWRLNQVNASPCGMWAGWLHLGNQWIVIIGPPLMLAALAGAWVWLRRIPVAGEWESNRRAALVAGMVLGIGLVFALPTAPVFRKFALLLPFVFLCAAWGVVWLAKITTSRPMLRGIAALLLVALVDTIPLKQSAEVLRAHLGLGRVIHWAHQHRAGKELRWMINRRPLHYTPADLCRDDSENLVIVCLPKQALYFWPSFTYSLYAARPLYSEPHLLATQSIYGGRRMRKDMKSRRLCVFSDVRVYRTGDLARHLRHNATLRLADLRTDSTAGPLVEPANLFDHDASPDRVTSWASDQSASPHRIRLVFEETAEMDSVAVVLPLNLWDVSRLERLRVRVAGENQPLRTVWLGRGLQEHQVVVARFPPQPVRRVVLELWSFGDIYRPSDQVQVQELIFPGYSVEAPRPQREFPPLILERVEQQDSFLVAHGKHITPYTRLVLGGHSLEQDFARYNSEACVWIADYYPRPNNLLTVRLPENGVLCAGRVTVKLADGLRESNPLAVDLSTGSSPCAPDAHPAAAHAANQPATVQARTGAVKQANRR